MLLIRGSQSSSAVRCLASDPAKPDILFLLKVVFCDLQRGIVFR